jgi:peptidoglycan/LPS O-acetylase OafA/YrhL
VFPPLFTPLWSLPLEVEMYVVLPLLFLIFRNRPVKLLAATWGVFVVLAFVQPSLGDRFLILRYVPCFLGGVVAWRLMRERDRVTLPAWLWPLAIAATSLIWMMATEKFLPLGIAAFGLCLGLVIPLFREIHWSAATRVSRTMARYSYGIYLVHFPIMVFVLRSPRYPQFKLIHQLPHINHFARPAFAGLIFSFTVLACLGLYHFIEDPGIRLGQKVARYTTKTRAHVARLAAVAS